MEKLNLYQTAILRMLAEHEFKSNNMQSFILADKERHHYQLMILGEKKDKSRFIGLRIHLQLTEDGKIWVLENKTEYEIGEELVEFGVNAKDIIAGFLPEEVRQYSGYGIN